MKLFRGNTRGVRGVAFTPDGSMPATASQGGTGRPWDARSGLQDACHEWVMGPLGSGAIAPDGMTIAAGGERDVVAWDVDV